MPTNLYGPGDNYDPHSSHVMASLIRKFYEASKKSKPTVICWGSGSPYREFLYADDLGEASVYALENWDPDSPNAPQSTTGEPLTFLNVGSGKEISIKDLAKKIATLLNYTGKIIWDKTKPDGTPRKLLNIDRISKLGWEPRVSLDEGIKNTAKLLEEEEEEIIN